VIAECAPSASLNSASAPRRELFLPSHLALRHHRGSMLNFLALPQGRRRDDRTWG
jgi:hypothetical protein